MRAAQAVGPAMREHQRRLTAALREGDRRAARLARTGLMAAMRDQWQALLRGDPGPYGVAVASSGMPCSTMPANSALPSGSTSSLKS